ncbi:MAG: pilin [Candidatus Paceibacterota bacterium]
MKKISLKSVLVCLFIFLGIFLLFFSSSLKVYAQAGTQNDILVQTTGYSVLSPSSFVFSGAFSGNFLQKPFTTYFEFKKGNSDFSVDAERTIEIVREKNVKEDNVFYTSPELKLFSTYYFRAVGFLNDNPSKKFYGNVLSMTTGPTFAGAFPFTIGVTVDSMWRTIGTIFLPFAPTEIVTSVFLLDVTDKTASIRTIIFNKNPQSLKLKVEYGEDQYDLVSDFIKIDEFGNTFFILKNLTPETKYYFILTDTSGKLDSSQEGSFTTRKANITSDPIKKVVSTIYNVSPTSIIVKADIYNIDFHDLDLKVVYGEGKNGLISSMAHETGTFKFDPNLGIASYTLDGLKPDTTYQYHLVDANTRDLLTTNQNFTTLNAIVPKPPISNLTPTISEPNTGLVKCGTDKYEVGDSAPNGKIIPDKRPSDTDVEGVKAYNYLNQIKNPCGFYDILTLINTVIQYITTIFVSIAAIMFAYAGVELITSEGETSKREKAKKIFTNVVIGLIVVLAAFLIVQTILSIVGYDKSLNWFGF